jgi:hypothetical protein
MNKNFTVYDRTKYFADNLNKYLLNLTGYKKDYFNYISNDQFIELKQLLSDINNILTLKTTEAFVKWLSIYSKFTKSETEEIIKTINEIKPNTNGYDIEISNKYKIIAEIKCIIPINNGNYYGAAQRNSILDDANKLINGKRTIKDTRSFIKFLGLIDLGDKTNTAISKIMEPAKNIRTKQTIRLERHEIVNSLKLFDENINLQDLSTNYIYIKPIKI